MIERTITEWIRHHVLVGAGLERATIDDARASADALLDPHVLDLARARLQMGYLRYQHTEGHSPRHDVLAYAARAITLYRETANREHLIDALNFVLLEWHAPRVPGGHWTPTHSEDHGRHACAGDTVPAPPPVLETTRSEGWQLDVVLGTSFPARSGYYCVGCAIVTRSEDCPICGSALPECR